MSSARTPESVASSRATPQAVPPRDQVRHPLAVSGQEDDEIRVDPVAQLRRLGDELVPRGHEEPQVLTPVGEPDRGKRLLPGRHPGDRERIRRIALAGSMRPQALAMRQVGRHVPDVEARRSQPTCRSRAISAAPLDADPIDGERAGPVRECHMTGSIVAERPLVDRRPEFVHRTARKRRLVAVDPDDLHRCALQLCRYHGRGPVRQVCVE